MLATMPRKKQEDWPKFLRAVQQRTGKTHAQLAVQVGVSMRTWRAWLYHERTPSKSAKILIRLLFPEK